MKISKRQLSLIIENYLLTEGVHDKAAREVGLTDPDKIEQLRIASEKPHRLQKRELLWIGKYFTTPEGLQTKEPIEDIVASIKSLAQNKKALERRGSNTQLEDYQSPGQINIAVSLSRGVVHISQVEKQADNLYEDNDWVLYMPHTREASCTIGSGTAWCTAIAGSGNNLFYNYVIKGRAILYYFVKKDTEGLDVDDTHFSLGTMGGKIPFETASSGGIVVDGKNEGLSRSRFLQSVGAPLGEKIISIVETHAQENANKHPAKQKVFEILRNPLLYDVEIKGKSIDAVYDFTEMLTDAYASHFRGFEQEKSDEKDLMREAFLNPDNRLNKSISNATEIKNKHIAMLNKAMQSGNSEAFLKLGMVYSQGKAILSHYSSVAKKSSSLSTFCKNLDALAVVLPHYFYSKTESYAEQIIKKWDAIEMPDIVENTEVKAFARNYELFSEHDDTLLFDRSWDLIPVSYRGYFGKMLGLYLHNLLFKAGYNLINDPEENVYYTRQSLDAGEIVYALRDYLDQLRTGRDMFWVHERMYEDEDDELYGEYGYDKEPAPERFFPGYQEWDDLMGGNLERINTSKYGDQPDHFGIAEFRGMCQKNGFTFQADR